MRRFSSNTAALRAGRLAGRRALSQVPCWSLILCHYGLGSLALSSHCPGSLKPPITNNDTTGKGCRAEWKPGVFSLPKICLLGCTSTLGSNYSFTRGGGGTSEGKWGFQCEKDEAWRMCFKVHSCWGLIAYLKKVMFSEAACTRGQHSTLVTQREKGDLHIQNGAERLFSSAQKRGVT